MKRLIFAVLITAATGFYAASAANPVGEMHLIATEPIAALRDAKHRGVLRITIWYPAAAGSEERTVTIGPSEQPLRDVGQDAPKAPFAAGDGRRPAILLSHGFGGSARIMGWLGIPLARSGYIVIAVDHHGNNGIDRMTVAGAILWWDRAEDLRTALDAVRRDPAIAPHLDAHDLGLAGFSAGGFTALVAAGARVDRAHFFQFCAAHPEDGVCRPQRELPRSKQDLEAAAREPDIAADIARAGDNYAIPGKCVRCAPEMSAAATNPFVAGGATVSASPSTIETGTPIWRRLSGWSACTSTGAIAKTARTPWASATTTSRPIAQRRAGELFPCAGPRSRRRPRMRPRSTLPSRSSPQRSGRRDDAAAASRDVISRYNPEFVADICSILEDVQDGW